MPALKEEYDYYEYASRRRQGTVKNAVPSSVVRKNTTSSKSNVAKTSTRSNYNKSTHSNVNTKNLKTTTTRDITKNAIRVATRDDSFIGNKKKTSTTSAKKQTSKKTSLDPVVFNKKVAVKKPQEITLKRPVSNLKTKNVAKQKARVKEMFRNVVTALFVFGMLFLICYRYSTINEAFNNLNNVKNELKNKNTVNAQIESNIKQNTDLSYIENYAKYQLGMQKPKDSQIQKVSVQKQDKIILPVAIQEEVEEKNFFEKLIEKVVK